MVFGTIGGFIATSVFGLAAGSAGATIVGGLIGGGLAFGAQSLLGEYMNRSQARPMGAIQGTIKIGGDIPAEAVYGRAKTKGQRLYYAKYGPGDEFNSEVLVLSNGWCDGLEPYVYFYGKKHNLVELPKIGNEVAHYGVEGYWYDNNPNGDNCFSIRFYDGRPGQQADQKLVDDTAGLGRVWKPNSKVTGHTYVVVRMRFDGDADFADNGRPELEFVLRGLRLYDPRKDSTVAGGSGTHRIDDPSTWEWSENPALQRLNYQLGLRGLISDRTIIGEGKTLGQIDLGTYFASMNICDTLKNGKPTYACSLIVNADDDHTEVLKVFDDAMAGYGLNRRGLSGVIAGAPQLPMLEITEADIDVGRPSDYRERKNAFELYNHMSGQFISIEDNWKPASLKPIHVNADVAVDGRPRQTGYDLLQITDPDIAQYVLTIRYRQQRLGARYESLPVSKRVGLQVEEGKWVTFRGREWLVQGWNLDEDFNFTLTLAETGAGIYDDDDIEPGPIIVPSPPPINPSLLSNVQDFAVEVGIVEGAGGMQAPALRFSWTPPNDATIDYVRFQYGPGTAPPDQPFEDVCANAEAGEYVTTKNVEGGNRYVARQSIRTVPDRFKTWGQWVVTADVTDVRFSDILDDSVTASKIAEAAVTADKLMDEAVTSIKLAAEAVTESKLAVGAASERVIAAGAVVAEKIADLAVTSQKVADAAIDTAKLANGAVDTAKLADQAVNLTKFASGLTPVEIRFSLPTSGNFEGRTVAIDGKLRQYVGGSWTTVNFEGLAPGSVTGDKLADAAVTAAKLQHGAVTHDKLSAGSVYGDVVAAGSITARELILTDFTNLIPDNQMTAGAWVVGGAGASVSWVDSDPAVGWKNYDSARFAQVTSPSQTAAGLYSRWFSVKQGDELFARAQFSPVSAQSGADPTGWITFQFAEDESGLNSQNGAGYSAQWSGPPLELKVSDVVPANKSYARIAVHKGATSTVADYRAGGVFVQRKANADLIVDGAITAEKIFAGAVTADKIATNAVTTAKIMAGAVKADQVAANAITTGKMAVGLGRNLVVNSSFQYGVDGWGVGSTIPSANREFGIRPGNASWGSQFWNIAYSRIVAVPAAGDYADIVSPKAQIKPGQRYEARMNVSAHGASRAALRIQWLDATGGTVDYAWNGSETTYAGNSDDPESWDLLTAVGDAPASARFARIHLRHTAQQVEPNNIYLFLYKPQIAETVAGATEPVPWSDGGVTLITPGAIATDAVRANHIFAGSVTAGKMAANSVTTQSLQAGSVNTAALAANAVTAAKILAGTITATELSSGSITTVKLAAGAVTAEKIQGETITGDKIAGSTIAGDRMVAGAITARELIVTNWENLIPNGGWEKADVSSFWTVGGGASANLHWVDGGYTKTGARSLNLQKSGGAGSLYITSKDFIPITGGEVYYGETEVTTNSGAQAAGFYYRFMWYDSNKSHISNHDVAANAPFDGSWTPYTGRVAAPGNASFVLIRIYNHSTSSAGNCIVDRVILRRAANANLIVDGAITADKLGVNKLSAIAGDVGELVAGLVRSTNNKIRLDLDGELFTMDD